MLDPIANLLTLTLSIALPLYASHTALLTSSPTLLIPWLTYWLVLALTTTILSILPLSYLPFYAWLRLGLHLYLLLPGETQGATWVYRTYICPVLVEHEGWIEGFIEGVHDRATTLGLEYWQRFLEYVKAQLLGDGGKGAASTHSAPTAPAQPPPPYANVPAQNYAQSLLSRFSLPMTRPTVTVPATTDMYALLSAAIQAATAATGSPSTSPPSTTDPANLPSQHAPAIPPVLATPAERLKYISSQSERLRALLGVFDKHAEELAMVPEQHVPMEVPVWRMPGSMIDSVVLEVEGLEGVEGGGLGGEGSKVGGIGTKGSVAGGMKKSKSEAEFEVIGDIDAEDVDKAAKQGSAGWGTWLWGKKYNSKGKDVKDANLSTASKR